MFAEVGVMDAVPEVRLEFVVDFWLGFAGAEAVSVSESVSMLFHFE